MPKLLCSFIEITLPYGCSPVNLLHIFKTPFYKNTYRDLLLKNTVEILFIFRPERYKEIWLYLFASTFFVGVTILQFCNYKFINLKFRNSWKDISKHLILSETSLKADSSFFDGNPNSVEYQISGVSGSKPAQMSFQDFWAQTSA